jgi:hypothetical protein
MWAIPQELIDLRDIKKIQAFIVQQFKDPQRYLARIAEIEATKGESFDRLELTDGRFVERYCDVISVEERVVGPGMEFSKCDSASPIKFNLAPLGSDCG